MRLINMPAVWRALGVHPARGAWGLPGMWRVGEIVDVVESRVGRVLCRLDVGSHDRAACRGSLSCARNRRAHGRSRAAS